MVRRRYCRLLCSLLGLLQLKVRDSVPQLLILGLLLLQLILHSLNRLD